MASRLAARVAWVAKQRQWQDALSLLAPLRQQLDEPLAGSAAHALTVACTATATASLRCLSWQVALEVLQSLQPDAWDQVTFCTALTACDRGLQWRLALQLLGRMDKDALDVNDFVASAAISACGKSSSWTVSLQLLEQVCVGESLESWGISINASISALAHGQQWAQCLDLLRRCMEAGSSLGTLRASASSRNSAEESTASRGTFPDVVAFNATLAALSKQARWPQALNVLLTS